ncbi:hypothetical protein [Adhaeribacter pallidiroseus]|uniref:hypothetical protein n=1 Tax=Adhaeribacter pallidiroseus TaxID=2072847 RepID=UPI0029374759|nr:hypothetical protein [Adhaeribacter pallidiroseus]
MPKTPDGKLRLLYECFPLVLSWNKWVVKHLVAQPHVSGSAYFGSSAQPALYRFGGYGAGINGGDAIILNFTAQASLYVVSGAGLLNLRRLEKAP